MQVLKLAEKAGLAKLGHVALDGTKIKANASKHKAMSYERMKTRETELRAEVDRWLEAVQAADAQEDKLHGASRRGDEMPGWIADKQRRLAKIREAREALEAEAAAAAAAKAKAERAAEEKRKAENRKRSGPVPRPPSKGARSQGAAQLYRSRQPRAPDQGRLHPGLQRASGGRRGQANHRGAWTDAEHERLSATRSPVDAVRANLGRKPREISADAGYCSEDNLLALATRKIHAYVAPGRAKHPAETTRKVGGEMTQKMRRKLKRAGYRSRYRLRKQIVEPVFGQIKQARGFRQFLLRGLEAVQAEWALILHRPQHHKARQGDLRARLSPILTPSTRYLDRLLV